MMEEDKSKKEDFDSIWEEPSPDTKPKEDNPETLQQREEEYDEQIEKFLFGGKFAAGYFEKTNENGKPDFRTFQPDAISEDIRKFLPIVTLKDNDEIYIYNKKKGYYEPNGERTLRALVKKILRLFYRERFAKAVIDDITASTYIERDDFTLPEYLIPAKNGLLDVSKNPPELLPHSPEYFITGMLPVEYNPNAKCPKFLKFLEQILPEIIDRLQIQEGFGNCLTPSHEYMIIFFLYGEGHNGKSTLLSVLTSLLGEKNVSNASLSQLAHRRWYVAEMYRKLANIYADIGIKELKYTGVIKIMTGEDRAFGEKKFKDPFKFKNYAKPWFSGNMVPYVYDDSDAFFRRWILIIFRQIFPRGAPQTDPQMIKKLTTSEEMSGILNWALEGYYRLRKQKTFTALKTVGERRKQWKEFSDPLSVFLANCIVLGEFVTKEDLYLSYKEFCLERGFRVMSKSLVGRRMKEQGYEEGSMRKEPGGKQYRSWIGIEVKNEFLVEAEEEQREVEYEGLDKVWEEEVESK